MVSRIRSQLVDSFALLAFVLVLVMLCSTARAVGADEKKPAHRLAAAGNDQILWVVVGEWDAQANQWVNWFAYQEKTKKRMTSAIAIRPQVRRIDRWAVVGESLDVFFENGTHYRYSETGGRREQYLPGRAVPLATAGQPGRDQPYLWAVVNAETAQAVKTRWETSRRARGTQPATTHVAQTAVPAETSATKPSDDIRPDVCHLVQYDGDEWRPGFPAPRGCGRRSEAWLCLSGDQCHLFWQTDPKSTLIRYAQHEGGSWAVKEPILLTAPMRRSLAAVINRQVVFFSLVEDAKRSPLTRCERWVWLPGVNQPDHWHALSPLQGDKGDIQYLPGDTALASFGDQLLAFRMSKEPEVEAASWSAVAEEPPVEPFHPVSIPRTSSGQQREHRPRDLIPMLIVGAVMLLVFWVRQERFSSPVALPAGVSIVGPARRGAAVLLDFVPAMAVVALIWHDSLAPFFEEMIAAFQAGDDEAMRLVQVPASLIWANVSFRLVYALYCLVFELIMSATPGKWFLGCEVASESLERPNLVQITIRNLTKLVELEPTLLIWPFVLVIFFTRNRQRVGDLLARTIVVQRRRGGGQETPSGPNESHEA